MTINIGLAFGGVLADIETAFAAHMKRALGKGFAIRDLRSLDLMGFYEVREDRIEYERGKFLQQWFLDTKPYPDTMGAIEILKQNARGISFHIITTMPESTSPDMRKWLDTHYGAWQCDIHFAEGTLPIVTNKEYRSKRAVCLDNNIDLFIETHPVRAQAVSMSRTDGAGVSTILLSRPWNEHMCPLNEVHAPLEHYWDWNHVLREIQNLA